MPRPPAELRKLDDEERRRSRAHRKLRWEGRVRAALWILGSIGLIALVFYLATLSGFFRG